MRVIVAHKGINAYRCCVKGQAAHSSLTPKGVNAIEYAARLICFIRDIADEFKANGPYDRDFDAAIHHRPDRHHPGAASRSTPSRSAVRVRVRVPGLPGVDPEAIFARIQGYANEVLLPGMRASHGDAGLTISQIAAAPSLDVAEQEKPSTQLVSRADRRPRRQQGRLWHRGRPGAQRAGIPAVRSARAPCRYPAGAQARRVRRTGTTRRPRVLPAQAWSTALRAN
ncbi:peptidase dimerization domain-containing protein [Cupriavidus basilensis]